MFIKGTVTMSRFAICGADTVGGFNGHNKIGATNCKPKTVRRKTSRYNIPNCGAAHKKLAAFLELKKHLFCGGAGGFAS